MKGTLITFGEKLSNSYWFLPALMVIGAIVLSFITTTIDSTIGSDWMQDSHWFHANRPAGARALLSTVAGSMITVAGVTFSMTILSISYTTSQVGPRLINNFMGDKTNQFTLGTFISTFVYCLMVLRTVRDAESLPPGATGSPEAFMDLATAFVPQTAVLVGMLLTILSVGVLIFFIHHIPETIHVSNIIASVGRGLNEQIDAQFPTHLGDARQNEQDSEADTELPPWFDESAAPIFSHDTGYVEYIDGDGMLTLATAHDLVIHLQCHPGDFVTGSSVLLLASPLATVDEHIEKELSKLFICGRQRTPTQDLRFQVNQLVEVAMRALSPGVNDPFTAITCMEWLESALQTLVDRELPSAHRYDDKQRLRVIAAPITFAAFAGLVFDQLRPYVAADRNAALKMMAMLGNILVRAKSDRERRLLARYACALRRASRREISDTRSLAAISSRYRDILKLWIDPETQRRAQHTGNWTRC